MSQTRITNKSVSLDDKALRIKKCLQAGKKGGRGENFGAHPGNSFRPIGQTKGGMSSKLGPRVFAIRAKGYMDEGHQSITH